MDKTLLIGNGLNRTLKSSISWEDLLDDIANEYGVEYIDNLPMPLEFERIVNTILRKSSNPSSQIYNDIKKKIANKVQDKKLPANAIQHELCAIPVNAIITTNYDYLLENAYNQDFSYKDAKDIPAYCLLSSGQFRETGRPPGSRPDSGTSGQLGPRSTVPHGKAPSCPCGEQAEPP